MTHLWYIWGALAVLMLILEVFHPVFVFAIIGISALFSAVVSLFFRLEIQVAVFALSCLALFFTIRPVIIRRIYGKKETKVRTNVDALTGKKAMVEETVGPNLKPGRVKVGDESWIGISWNAETLHKGEIVEIVKVEGTKLYVRRKK